jgi:beta-lactamase regulating signal transducer with metallopeptidase domain
MTLLLAAMVDLSLILAIGLVAALLMRRRSAALRHGILAAAVVAGAAAPVLEVLLPPWPIPVGFGAAPTEVTSTLRFTTEAEPLTVVGEPTAFAAPVPLSWPAIAIIVWLSGALIGLIGLATGLVRLARITARCEPVRAGPWRETADRLSAEMQLPHVEILQSDNPSLLVTWGLLPPKIILPAGAADWSEPRRRIVLAHEMAHIARRDWLVHMCAETLRAFYWVNPLAWAVCRRLRQESEYACDDAVLSGGVDATDYASHLLAVARQAIGGRSAWVSAPAIAHPSTLERRIAAMLTEKRNREPLTRRASIAAVTAIVAVALPITALAVSSASTPVAPMRDVVLAAQIANAPVAAVAPAPTAAAPSPRNLERAAAVAAQQAPATLSVLVQDPSGAVLPGVQAALDNVDAGIRHRLVSDPAGRFSVTDLPPGRYQMVLSLPGFATVTNVMPVTPGLDVRRTITLPLGTLEETILVTCGTPAAATPASRPEFVVDRAAGVAYVNGERYERQPNALAAYASVQRAATRRLYTALAAQDQTALGAPVRVGGQIAAPRQIRRANPVCPRTVLPAPDTLVVLAARVGVDGYLNDLHEVAPADGAPSPAPEFVEAALDAVRQWGYTPTRLNNVPVEAGIRITVRFSR